MRTGWRITALTMIVLWLIAGCATLEPGYETPTVTVSSFRALPSGGVSPRFEIGLHIVNPNRSALDLEGIAYTISLEGHKVLAGATSDLPRIGAYSEGDVSLQASVDLFSSVSLIADLMNQPRQQFHYEFDAKLDVGKLRPRVHVTKSGEVALQGKAR